MKAVVEFLGQYWSNDDLNQFLIEYKNDYFKGLRYDIIIILISDKCRKIKNVKAYKKCSEKVLYKNGGIDYIDGNFTHFGCFNLKFNKNGDIDHIEEGVCDVLN